MSTIHLATTLQNSIVWDGEPQPVQQPFFYHISSPVCECSGCGPGSITLGLAEAVTPGNVVGLDLEQRQIDVARERAVEHGVLNVRFELGNAYILPFPRASFDVVFAHAVLKHVRDPLTVLKEFRRVLKPTGMVGISDLDWGTLLWEPGTPLLNAARALLLRVWEYNGSSPYYARHQRQFLLRAGFARAEMTTTATYAAAAGAPAETQQWARVVG